MGRARVMGAFAALHRPCAIRALLGIVRAPGVGLPGVRPGSGLDRSGWEGNHWAGMDDAGGLLCAVHAPCKVWCWVLPNKRPAKLGQSIVSFAVEAVCGPRG